MANYDLTYEGSRVQGILDTGNSLKDAGYIFRGEATPSTVPGTPTERVAYIGGPGTYTNFGGSITVGAGCICVFKYTGSAWSNQVINTGLDSAVNTLQSAITAINNNIGNGYVYAGVATPSTSPVTGKVFYLAITAGTYTNFGSAVVTAGLNVLKYNGSAWSVDQVIAIDAEPTQGSANLVKSGGVLNSIIQNGPAFDLSAYNAQEGVLATYADLSAALTALNALPSDFKKGGMSMKFVLTSDNNYVQARLKATSFSTDENDWAYEPYLSNGEPLEDFGIMDENKNYIVIFQDGHVKTRFFDSQKQVYINNSVSNKIDKDKIVQTTGQSESLIMSQKAVTDIIKLGYFVGNNIEYSFCETLYRLKPDYKYRVVIVTPYEYQGQGYTFSVNSYANGQQTTIAGTTASSVDGYYDITIPANSEYIKIGGRATLGSKVYFYIVDLTSIGISVINSNFLEEFSIADEQNNKIVVFNNGHIKTKKFDSDSISKDVNNLKGEIGNIEKDLFCLPDTKASGVYYGEKIRIASFNFIRENWKNFTVPSFVQSFAIYGDFIIFAYGTPNFGRGSVWRISTSAKLADITFPYGDLHTPHANVANFSNTFMEGNEDLPLLYVSQWDNEGACFVYDIHLDGTCNLIQTITSDDSMPVDVFGTKLGDWVLDNQNGYIYSTKYRVGAYHADGNKMMICKFNIPSLENPSVVLSESDIIDNFDIPADMADLTVTQDKVIDSNMHLFIGTGFGNDEYPAKINVIDLNDKKISSIVDLQTNFAAEPEGIDIIDNFLLYSAGDGQIYKLQF